jgi:hypothetical protein
MTFFQILTHLQPVPLSNRHVTVHATLTSATKEVLAAGDNLRAALRLEAAFRGRSLSKELDDEVRIQWLAARRLVDCALENYSAASQRLIELANRISLLAESPTSQPAAGPHRGSGSVQ